MKLLYVDCCITVHGSASRTAALAETFLSAWRAGHPEADLETRDLKTLTLNPLLGNALCLRETLQSEGRTEGASFALARQFAAADRIVIAAPFWDMSFPAVLKCFFEQTSLFDVTFTDTGKTCQGLCKAPKVLYITTRGMDISTCDHREQATPYLKALGSLWNLGDLTTIAAQNMDYSSDVEIESKITACIEDGLELVKKW